ncbi:DMT family transporter [Candidatus Micrarchaeota archaeon]|nr:DMT family transporter [Candidatus Micrarchaeota archaeon]
MFSEGLFLGILAAFFWGSADFFAKKAVTREKNFIPIHFSNLVAFFVIIAYNLLFSSPGYSLFAVIPNVFFVSLTMTSGWWFFWKSLQSGKLSLQTSVGATFGFVTLILAMLFLGERPLPTQIFGALTIIVGVFLLAGSKSLGKFKFDPNILLALLAAICWGTSYYLLATLFKFHPLAIILQSHLFFSVLISIGIVLLAGNRLFPTNPKNLLPAMIAGFIDSLGLICYYLAARLIPFSLLTPLSSIYPVFTSMLAYIFLKERLEKRQYVFLAMVIIGILLISV